MEEVETAGRRAGAFWCTSFAGHIATRLGFEASPGNAATSMFWSGYRLDLWARQGTTVTGTRVTPEGEEVAADGNASAMISGSDWQTLFGTLNGLHHNRPTGQSDAEFEAALQQAVDDFLSSHVVPQAGDMLIYDDNNRIRGNSHTNMVERYDATTRTIYTIGGNEGDAVGGRRVVLTDPTQVRRLASMVRVGAEFYTGATAPAGAGAQGEGIARAMSTHPADGAPVLDSQPGAAPLPAPGGGESEAIRLGTTLVQGAWIGT